MPEARIEIAVDDGWIDALAAWPDGEDPAPAVIVLSDRARVPDAERIARRLAARGYFGLVPHWTRRKPEYRRTDAEAWLDWLAGERRVDDERVGMLGIGSGADMALKAAAWRSERVAAVAALFGRGFASKTAVELAQRINALVHLGYVAGRTPGRGMASLEAALCAADVPFEVETYVPTDAERQRTRILDLFDRALVLPGREAAAGAVRRTA